jgi:hypothetical protein
MLISMPTGTSTIFGAFQAILALLLEPDGLRPPIKIMRKEKFASEILEMFRHKTSARLCCIAEADFGDAPSKQREINSFTVACIRANGDVVGRGRGEPRKST